MTEANYGEAFLSAVLERDWPRASVIARESLSEGLDYLYDGVIAPALYAVGTLWERQQISVADEHLIIAFASGLVSSLAPDLPWPVSAPVALIACCEGERHELGARMVAQLLAVEGWSTMFLGADTPVDELCNLAASLSPTLIGLSVSRPELLDTLRSTVTRLRNACPKARLVAGGFAVVTCNGCTQCLGADAYGENAHDAVVAARACQGSAQERAYSAIFKADRCVPALIVRGSLITQSNPAARALFGAAACPWRPVASLFHERSRSAVSRALTHPDITTCDLDLSDDAVPVPMRFLVAPLGEGHILVAQSFACRSGDGILARLVLQKAEITARARKLADQTGELTQAKSQLERVSEARERLLETVVHDLRSPLSAIMLRASHLGRSSRGASAEELRGAAESIKRPAERMMMLALNVMEASRMAAGELTLHLEPLSLGALVSEACDELEPAASRSAVRLALEIGEQAPLSGDRPRLFQVVVNVLDNAIRHSPFGSTVTVRVEATPGHVRCTIADQGAGVAASDRERIFERFTQGGGPRRGLAGLGLSIARDLVRAHGGAMWVEDAPDHGAAFVFDLPATRHP